MATKKRTKFLLGSLVLVLSLYLPVAASDFSSVLFAAKAAQGASPKTYYVNPGAKGAKTGLDWTNAFTDLPLKLERGSVYYLADGEYAGRRFRDEGTDWIRIKKAIPSDHGTDRGWTNSMGNSVAVFGPISFTAGNYEIDGQVGGGPNSFTSGHGIKITSDSDKAKAINVQKPVSNLIFNHIEATLGFKPGYKGQDILYGVKGGNNWTIKNSYLHHSSRTILYTMFVSDILIENSQLERNGQNQEQHSEIWSSRWTDNVVVRNNIIKDYVSTGGILIVGNNWDIYGNVFTWSKDFGRTAYDGAIGSWDSSDTYYVNNINIYNNSFINLTNGGSGRIFPIYNKISKVKAYNNLWHNSPTAKFGGEVDHDYNVFKDSNEDKITERNKQIETKNITGSNYKTTFSTDSGKSLPYPYDFDMHGNKRGKDGVWDRGAFEIDNKNRPTISKNDSPVTASNTPKSNTNNPAPTKPETNPTPAPNNSGSGTGNNDPKPDTAISSSSGNSDGGGDGNSSPAPSVSSGGGGGGGSSYTPHAVFSGLSEMIPEPKKNLPYQDGSLLKSFDSPAVYLIENDKKRVIISGEAFLSYGYKWQDIKQVDRGVLTWYADGPVLYPNPAVKISTAPATIQIPAAFKNANLVKIPGNPTVYAIVNGKKHPILNAEVFNLYGFKWGDVKTITPAQLNKYPRIALVKTAGTPTIYFINENRQKKKILNPTMLQAYGSKWGNVTEILPQELSKYPEIK